MLNVILSFDHAPVLGSRFQILSRTPDVRTELQLMQSTSFITLNKVCLHYKHKLVNVLQRSCCYLLRQSCEIYECIVWWRWRVSEYAEVILICLSVDFKWIINKSCLTFSINRSNYQYQVQQMQRLTQLWPLVGSACILVWYLNTFALMIMQSVRRVSDPRLCTQTRACRLTGHSVLLHARRKRNVGLSLITQAWTTSIYLYYWNDHTKFKAKILIIPICSYCSHRRPFHWSTITHDRSWGTKRQFEINHSCSERMRSVTSLWQRPALKWQLKHRQCSLSFITAVLCSCS